MWRELYRSMATLVFSIFQLNFAEQMEEVAGVGNSVLRYLPLMAAHKQSCANRQLKQLAPTTDHLCGDHSSIGVFCNTRWMIFMQIPPPLCSLCCLLVPPSPSPTPPPRAFRCALKLAVLQFSAGQ